ncbi:hypothetical protein ABPG74_015646 [Tetrahymena malaccensis]
MQNNLPDLSKSLVNDNIFISEKIIMDNHNSNIQYYSGYDKEKCDDICIKQLYENTISRNQLLQKQFEQEQEKFKDFTAKFLQINYEYMESPSDEYYLIASPFFESINKQGLPIQERVAKGIFLQLIEAFYELHNMNLDHYAICMENIGYNSKSGKIQLQRFGFESHHTFRNQPFEEEDMFLSPQYQGLIYTKQKYSSLSQDMFNLGAIMKGILLGVPQNQRYYNQLQDKLQELLESMTNPIEEKRMKWENLLDHSYFSLGQSQPYDLNRIQSHYNQRIIKNFYLKNNLQISQSVEILYDQQSLAKFNQYSDESQALIISEDVQTVNLQMNKSQAEISFVGVANQVMDELYSQKPFQVQYNEKKLQEDKKQERLSFQKKQEEMVNEFLSQKNIPQNNQNNQQDIDISQGVVIYQQQPSGIQPLSRFGTQSIHQSQGILIYSQMPNELQTNKQNIQNIQHFQNNQFVVDNFKQPNQINEGQSFKQNQQNLFNFTKNPYPYQYQQTSEVIGQATQIQNIRAQRFSTDQDKNCVIRNNLNNFREDYKQQQSKEQSPPNINIIPAQKQDQQDQLQQNPYHIIKETNKISNDEILQNTLSADSQNTLLALNDQLLQPEGINKSIGNKKIASSIKASEENEISISKSRQKYEQNLNLTNQLTQYFVNERNKYSMILNTCLLIYSQPESFFSKKDCFEHLINYAQLLNSLRLNYDLLSQLVDLQFDQREYTPELLNFYKTTDQYQNLLEMLFDDAFIIETWFLASIFDLDEFKNLQMNSKLKVSQYYLSICSELFKFVSKDSIKILVQIFEAQQPANQKGVFYKKWKLSKANIDQITNLRKSFVFNFNQETAKQLLDLQILFIKNGLEKKNSNITLQDVNSYKILYFLLYIQKYFDTYYVPQRMKKVSMEIQDDFDCGKFYDKINNMTDYIEIKKLISGITNNSNKK